MSGVGYLAADRLGGASTSSVQAAAMCVRVCHCVSLWVHVCVCHCGCYCVCVCMCMCVYVCVSLLWCVCVCDMDCLQRYSHPGRTMPCRIDAICSIPGRVFFVKNQPKNPGWTFITFPSASYFATSNKR